MRATVMYGAGDVRIEDVTDPKIVEPTDAVVRVTRACICGSDLWPYRSLEPGESGRVMGHEAVGVVEDVGASVHELDAGDVVVMPFAFSASRARSWCGPDEQRAAAWFFPHGSRCVRQAPLPVGHPAGPRPGA
jgi:threonine dehydrogenase-like Zn-dependent dehydrogenase